MFKHNRPVNDAGPPYSIELAPDFRFFPAFALGIPKLK